MHLGARVLVLRDSTIAAQRNLGIESAENHWILTVDADERVSPQLRAEVGQIVAGRIPTHAAYRMKFRNHYLGRELHYGPWGRDWHVRLVHARHAATSAVACTNTSSRSTTSEP